MGIKSMPWDAHPPALAPASRPSGRSPKFRCPPAMGKSDYLFVDKTENTDKHSNHTQKRRHTHTHGICIYI